MILVVLLRQWMRWVNLVGDDVVKMLRSSKQGIWAMAAAAAKQQGDDKASLQAAAVIYEKLADHCGCFPHGCVGRNK